MNQSSQHPLELLQLEMGKLSENDPCPLPTAFGQLTPIIWKHLAERKGVALMSNSEDALGSFIGEVSRLHILMGWILGRHQGEMISLMQRLWPDMEFENDT